MEASIRSKIAQREAELNRLDSRKAVIAVELALLRELLAEAEQAEAAAAERTETEAVRPSRRDVHKSRPDRAARIVGSNMSDRWKCVVVAAVRQFPTPLSNDDVPRIQQAAGQAPANKESVRSHVSTFKTGGLYEKSGIGQFRATEKAAALVGIPLRAGASDREADSLFDHPAPMQAAAE